MEERENRVREWFSMWLRQDCTGLETLFCPEAVYVESWGPEYHGADQIRLWFEEWNRRGIVLKWEIRQFFHKGEQTAVEWLFENRVDGRTEAFEGMTLICWADDGRILRLQEFGCNLRRYDPYENGPEPVFREENPSGSELYKNKTGWPSLGRSAGLFLYGSGGRGHSQSSRSLPPAAPGL